MQTAQKEIFQITPARFSTLYRNGTGKRLGRRAHRPVTGDLNACAWSSSPERDVSCTLPAKSNVGKFRPFIGREGP
jgi:hypothetical protein